MINGSITSGNVDVESYNHPDLVQNIQDVLKEHTVEHVIEDLAELYKTALARCIISIILSIISLVISSILLYGIHQAKFKYILPTLVWNPMSLAIETVEMISIVFLNRCIDCNDYIIEMPATVLLAVCLLTLEVDGCCSREDRNVISIFIVNTIIQYCLLEK